MQRRENDKLRKRLWCEKNPEREKEIRIKFKNTHPGYNAQKMADEKYEWD